MIQFLDKNTDQTAALVGAYDVPLVLLSYLVALLASFAGLLICDRINAAGARWKRLGWLVMGAVVMGFGVWSMHFIGMLAFVLPIAITYDVAVTMISVIPAVLASAFALYLLSSKWESQWLYIVSGSLLGLGIGSMHYTGMAGMKTAADMRYDPTLFVLSIGIAVVLGIGAVYTHRLGRYLFGGTRLIPSSLAAGALMGLAITGMHYTAMAATKFFPATGTTPSDHAHSLDPSWLALGVTLIASFIAFSAVAAMILARQLQKNVQLLDTTHRQLIEASDAIEAMNDGFMLFDENDQLLMCNSAFAAITGYTAEETLGQTPNLLKLVQQDLALSLDMNESIHRTGGWQGEIWDQRKNEEFYPAWLKVSAVRSREGEAPHYVATLTDISERKATEERTKHLAFHDPLTRLPNRRLFLDRLQHALASNTRTRRKGALIFIDLDNFKTLNDTLGHDKGDLLLQQVAQRLETCVREGDTVGRLGGDEFVLILENLHEVDSEAAAQAEIVGEKILAGFSQSYDLGGHEHHISASIGVTLFAGHEDSMDELLKQADLAMYQSKTSGRDRLSFFDPKMQAAVNARLSLEAHLRQGMKNEQFLLYYQPQVDDNGHLMGAEALLRWRHPQRGLVSPADFIPLAEDTGLILPLGQWVLETACRQLADWAKKPETADLHLSINVSARLFHQENFVDQVLATLDRSGADPHKLTLELTESVLLDQIKVIAAKMAALKATGVGFSLDDFGTGYSSLKYLKQLPIDQLKIDQSFVRDILTDPNVAAIAKTIITLAQSLELAIIAEGVETRAQRNFLAKLGCHVYQGYLFGRPGPVETLLLHRSLAFI